MGQLSIALSLMEVVALAFDEPHQRSLHPLFLFVQSFRYRFHMRRFSSTGCRAAHSPVLPPITSGRVYLRHCFPFILFRCKGSMQAHVLPFAYIGEQRW